ncbi:MAG: PIG-L family deacetylase [Anaerolineae bacterium]
MPKHLFLSPHLDDAVLSCGGTMHRLARDKADVVVLNVMAGDPPSPLPDSPLIQTLHQRWAAGENPVMARRAEDREAIEALGATVDYLPWPDCIYRTHGGAVLYPNGDGDIFGEIHPDDPARALIASALPQAHEDATTLYAPLGVGHHVDHQLVRDWAVALAARYTNLTIYFYEDYPYGEINAALESALQQMRVPLKLDIRVLLKTNFEAKVNAIAMYRSQLSTFWESIDQMRERLHAYMTESGQLVERYWRLAEENNA